MLADKCMRQRPYSVCSLGPPAQALFSPHMEGFGFICRARF